MKYLFSGDIQYVSGRKVKKKRWKKVLAVILILAFLGFSVASLVMVRDTYEEMFGRAERPTYTLYQTYGDVAGDYRRTDVTFPSEENLLQGHLYGATKNPRGLVVISHGLGGGADDYLSETCYFVDQGYRVLAYDNTGSYDSEGDGVRGLSQSVIDLDAALTWVEQQSEFERLPLLLYGHSWGGYAVTAILNYHHQIAGVVSVAGYNTPMEMITDWCKDEMGLLTYVEYPYIWLYQKYIFGGASNLSAVAGINKAADTPVMLIHGSEDTVVPTDSAAIAAHKEEITNPYATVKIYSEAGQNGHNNLFVSPESLQYISTLNEQFDALEAEYQGNIPPEVEKDWYAGVDKNKTSILDKNFMQEVCAFFKAVIEKEK